MLNTNITLIPSTSNVIDVTSYIYLHNRIFWFSENHKICIFSFLVWSAMDVVEIYFSFFFFHKLLRVRSGGFLRLNSCIYLVALVMDPCRCLSMLNDPLCQNIIRGCIPYKWGDHYAYSPRGPVLNGSS